MNPDSDFNEGSSSLPSPTPQMARNRRSSARAQESGRARHSTSRRTQRAVVQPDSRTAIATDPERYATALADLSREELHVRRNLEQVEHRVEDLERELADARTNKDSMRRKASAALQSITQRRQTIRRRMSDVAKAYEQEQEMEQGGVRSSDSAGIELFDSAMLSDREMSVSWSDGENASADKHSEASPLGSQEWEVNDAAETSLKHHETSDRRLDDATETSPSTREARQRQASLNDNHTPVAFSSSPPLMPQANHIKKADTPCPTPRERDSNKRAVNQLPDMTEGTAQCPRARPLPEGHYKLLGWRAPANMNYVLKNLINLRPQAFFSYAPTIMFTNTGVFVELRCWDCGGNCEQGTETPFRGLGSLINHLKEVHGRWGIKAEAAAEMCAFRVVPMLELYHITTHKDEGPHVPLVEAAAAQVGGVGNEGRRERTWKW